MLAEGKGDFWHKLYSKLTNGDTWHRAMVRTVCHSEVTGSIGNHSSCDLWWTKWHCDRLFCQHFSCPLVVSLHTSALFLVKCVKLTAWLNNTLKLDTRNIHMYNSTLSLTSALGECGWLRPRPGRFTPPPLPPGINCSVLVSTQEQGIIYHSAGGVCVLLDVTRECEMCLVLCHHEHIECGRT